MSSSKQPIVWDSVTFQIAAGNTTIQTHRVKLPQGCIGWRLVNGDPNAANTVEVAGNLTTITAGGGAIPGHYPITVPGAGGHIELLAGQDVYVRNRNNATPFINVMWWRASRQPDPGAGTATISGNLTP